MNTGNQLAFLTDMNKRFQIPKSLQLLGHTIEVRVIPARKWPHKIGTIGSWDPDKLQIDILDCPERSRTEQVFFHELVHAILTMLSQNSLNRRESMVNSVAHLLHQALTTSRYR